MTKPTELFVASADGQGERQLTHLNDKVNAEIAWSDAERFTYKSVGGLEIEAWKKKDPIVLLMGFLMGVIIAFERGRLDIDAVYRGGLEDASR